MRTLLAILALAFLFGTAEAQVPACLKASCIPDSLKKGAHAVMRLDEVSITYQSVGHYRESMHQLITVLDDSGEHHFHPAFAVDRFKKVMSLDVRILDANGVEVKRYGQKDFESFNYDDGYSLATDANYIRLEALHTTLPCTIDIKVEIDVSGSISPPSWSFVSKGNAVESSRFSISMPAGLDLLYRKEHGAGEPVATLDKNVKSYMWTARGLPANGVIDPSTGRRRFPRLQLSVTPFQYGGYKGEIRNWRSFGKWFWDLYQEPAEPFSPARKEEIKSMFKNAGSSRQVIDSLYRYMQRNMRYVSIQLGIGGLKPFPVSFVDQKKYGDCKALTNYMRYLLLEAGIKSYPALINAGDDEEPIDTSFASSQFNHVILCVPFNGGDTTWLECTSKFTQPGVLGSFTENRYALLIREDGGHIVSTPRSVATGNILTTRMVVELDPDGSGKGELSMDCKGDFLQAYLEYRAKTTREEWKRYMVREAGLKEPDAFIIAEPRPMPGGQPLIQVAYEKVPVVNSGGKLFIPLRLVSLNPGSTKFSSSNEPTTPFTRIDSSIYILPAGFHPQSLPPEQHMNTSFGSFETEYVFEKESNRLVIRALLTIDKLDPRWDTAHTADLFVKAVKEEPGRLLVIVKD